ncbi:MAG: AAA family ATPase, partial [Betaproteobacteria bacterium]
MAEPAVRRLALLGGESSGKTTLARALAGALHTSWVPEYGRQRWEELRETLSLAELVAVVVQRVLQRGQRRRVADDPAAARGGGARGVPVLPVDLRARHGHQLGQRERLAQLFPAL